jgi:hypothetical protein
MKTLRVFGFAVAVAAVAFVLSTSHASAQPVAGAYYAGEITGCGEPPCGTVHFTVSGDASQVQGFTASDVPGAGCRFQGPQPYPFDLDIVGDSFGPGPLDWYVVSGSFSSEGNAQGTLRLAMGEPLCDTGVLDWTAAVAPLPVGGIAELPDVSDSSARNYVALAGLAAAALVALATGARYARRWRLG